MGTLVPVEETLDALDVMYALRLEDGRRWGDIAVEWQIEDAKAVHDLSGPNKHFLTRPRGASKTSDIAGLCLSWLITEAPPRARGYVVAANGDQAGLLIDAAAGFVARTPELDGVVTVENERILANNGAWVRVLNLSDSGAWGLRDVRWLVLDEFAQWPETRGARRVYTAVRTTVQKTPGCRLVILTSAGEPSHWSYTTVFRHAQNDPTWRVHEVPGPVPWQSPEELESIRAEFASDPSAYDRLILNRWTEAEDRAIRPEDYEACLRQRRVTGPQPGVKYLITVDIGIRHDATAMAICHAEPFDAGDPSGPKRVVTDHIERWKGSRRKPVQVKRVEDWLATKAPQWNGATVYADPTQFVGSLQNLNRRGVRAKEWPFTSSSVGQVATALVQAFRNRQIEVPDIPALREELLAVRLRESSPGVTRLDHDPNGHDDQAVVLGMACHLFLGGQQFSAKVWAEGAARRKQKLAEGRPRRGCTHRWRADGICMFGCGATRDEVERENPHRSRPSGRAFDPRRLGGRGRPGLSQPGFPF